MKENELYPHLSSWFESMDFTVRGEVNDCDLVAVKNDEVIVVELKNTFNLQLLMQGVERQRYSDLVYLAIWKPKNARSKRWKEVKHLIRRLELGLILVGEHGSIDVVIEPKAFDMKQSKRLMKRKRISLMNEVNQRSGNFNIGGSTRTKITTAYKEKTLYLVTCMKLKGDLSIKELKQLGADEKKTSSILQKNFEGWFERKSRGIYGLTYKGELAYNDYHYITENMMKKIRDNCDIETCGG